MTPDLSTYLVAIDAALEGALTPYWSRVLFWTRRGIDEAGGDGYGNGYGGGDGFGYGFGYGDGYGEGYGDGFGYGDGDG